MKAKLIITGLLFSLLLIFSGCATTGEYGSGGSGYLYNGSIYGGAWPYWYPGYGGYYGYYGYGYYGDYGAYPYWYYPPGGFYYYPGGGFYGGLGYGSLRGHGYVNNGRRFRSHDPGNVGDHAGRHYFRDEGRRQYHGRADGAGQGYGLRGYNGSGSRMGGGHHGGAHGRR